MNTKRRGWSLVEVLTVVAIISVIALVATFSLRQRLPTYRLQKASETLEASLRNAHMRAMSYSRPTSVMLNTAVKSLVTSSDENDNGSIDVSEVATLKLTSDPAIALSSLASGGRFDPNGTFACTTGYWRVTFSHPEAPHDAYVYVFQGGHIEETSVKLD